MLNKNTLCRIGLKAFVIVSISLLDISFALAKERVDIPAIDCMIEPNVLVELSSPVAGVIDTLTVDKSDEVKKGQVIATLKSDIEQVNVRSSREKLKLSAAEYKRAAELYREKAITKSEKEQLDNDKKLAELELKHAKTSLDLRKIKSPIDGIVVKRYANPGEFVETKPILQLAQLNPLRIEVVSPVENYGNIVKGMQARIAPEFGEYNDLVAKVVVVDKVVDAASGTFSVRLELENKDYTIPGGLKCSAKFMPIEEMKVADKDVPKDKLMDNNISDKTVTDNTGIAKQKAEMVTATNNTVTKTKIIEKTEKKEVINISDKKIKNKVVAVAKIPGKNDQDNSAVSKAPVNTDALQQEKVVSSKTVASKSANKKNVAENLAAKKHITKKQVYEKVCKRIGPYKNQQALANVFLPLNKVIEQVELNKINKSDLTYQVVSDMFSSRSEAEQIKSEMRAAGISDTAYLSIKNNQQLALGVYRSKKSATKRMNSILAKGFGAEVNVRNKQKTAYFAEIKYSSASTKLISKYINAKQQANCAKMRIELASKKRP